MNCRTAQKLIPAMLDGELDPGRAERLNEHLVSCSGCRAEAAAIGRAMEAMGAWSDVEPHFTMADIREQAAQRRGRWAFRWVYGVPRLAGVAMAIAAIAAGGITGAYYGSHSSTTAAKVTVSEDQASDTFALDAFDDGLAGAVYVVNASADGNAEVTQ